MHTHIAKDIYSQKFIRIKHVEVHARVHQRCSKNNQVIQIWTGQLHNSIGIRIEYLITGNWPVTYKNSRSILLSNNTAQTKCCYRKKTSKNTLFKPSLSENKVENKTDCWVAESKTTPDGIDDFEWKIVQMGYFLNSSIIRSFVFCIIYTYTKNQFSDANAH